MKAPLYLQILENTWLPFLRDVFPNGHCFMQDNDLNIRLGLHGSSCMTTIYWWKTSPESQDVNPIEKMWHKLKEYIRREVKSKTKQELITGTESFWETVTKEKCKYIRH